jgi:uncharacterized protein (TIGR00299 family) protein
MIVAALFDSGLDERALVEGLRALGLKGIEINITEVARHGIRAKSFGFKASGGPKTGTFEEIVAVLETSGLAAPVKSRAIRAFDFLAEAEGRIHGQPKAKVHFHEVGSLDSVVDVVAASIGLDALGIERVVSSPLALGMGLVRCEHGTLPSPAPATLEIARGLPVRGWAVEGELTTPTGAAILKASATAFGPIPEMTVAAVGYGAGTRDLEGLANVMRFVVGEAAGLPGGPGEGREVDRVTLIQTNIDDMNPQFFSHIFDDLFARGALDVWVGSLLAKKGRPGFLLSVLAESQRVPALVDLVLRETTTSGVRLQDVARVKLPRRIVEVGTRFGKIRAKVFAVERGERCAPEYEDCLQSARAHGATVSEVMEEARNAFRQMREAGK